MITLMQEASGITSIPLASMKRTTPNLERRSGMNLDPVAVKTEFVGSMEAYATFENSGPEAWEGIKEPVAELLAIIAEYEHALHHVENCTNNAACANCVGLAKAALHQQPNVPTTKAEILADFNGHEVALYEDEEEEDDE